MGLVSGIGTAAGPRNMTFSALAATSEAKVIADRMRFSMICVCYRLVPDEARSEVSLVGGDVGLGATLRPLKWVSQSAPTSQQKLDGEGALSLGVCQGPFGVVLVQVMSAVGYVTALLYEQVG